MAQLLESGIALSALLKVKTSLTAPPQRKNCASIASRLRLYDSLTRRREGVELVGGVDEVGRGALAGPVVVGAVVLGPEAEIEGVNDSKQLKPDERERLAPEILRVARAAALGMATPREIDEVNILQATHLAAERALAALELAPQFLITDFLKLRSPPCPLLAITKGDSTSLAVAAASVLAKVARDRLMTFLDDEFPQYGFASNKGYGSPRHLQALQTHGPSAIHRLTFAGVCWFNELPAEIAGDADRIGGEIVGCESLLRLLRVP